jgi:hypothetical protein
VFSGVLEFELAAKEFVPKRSGDTYFTGQHIAHGAYREVDNSIWYPTFDAAESSDLDRIPLHGK